MTPPAACCELGIAAVISFCWSRRYWPGAASPRGGRPARAAARAPDRRPARPRLAAPAGTLRAGRERAAGRRFAALTEAFDAPSKKFKRSRTCSRTLSGLATEAGDLSTAQALTGHADALAAGSEIPHRQANALYCRGLLDGDAPRLLVAAERYDDASRPLLQAMALDAAAGYFVEVDDRDQARAAFTQAVEVYAALGALLGGRRSGCRARFRRRPRHPARAVNAKHRRSQSGAGTASRRPRLKIAAFVEEVACRTRRSPPGCCSPGGTLQPRPTSPGYILEVVARRLFADRHRPRGGPGCIDRAEVIEDRPDSGLRGNRGKAGVRWGS